MLVLGAMIALTVTLLPAAAGVALGHDATSTCDSIKLSKSNLNANIYVHGTHTTGTLVMTVPGNHTYTIASGHYDVVWTDGVEVDNLSVGKCPATITTVASPNTGKAGVAMTVGDTATLHAPVTFVTGTLVTFTLYSDNTCTTSTGVTGSGALNSSKIASYSQSWTPAAAGTYYWMASFPGDAYNSSYVSGCGDANETVTVGKASPTIATTLSATNPVAIGTTVHDSATLTGATSNAGGSVTYTVYTDDTCSTVLQGAGKKTVSGGSVPNSDAITFNNAGTWYWQAVYSGDDNNAPATSPCKEETLTVGKKGPTIVTTLSATNPVAIGTTVHDSAIISNGTADISGTVTYTVYTDETCSTVLQGAGTKTLTVAHLVPDSDAITFNNAGTWYWQAVYSGDANNATAKSTCKEETLTVGKNGPTIATTLSKSRAEVGTVIHDSATLAGVTADAGGTVKYTVFSDATCRTVAQEAGSVNVNKGSVPNSNDIPFNNVGTWYWQAVYSGDGNNAGATSACTEETLVIDPSQTPFMSFKGATATPKATPTPTPTPTATATPTIIIGGQTGTPRAQTLPPTSSDHGSSSGGPTPLFAFAICLLFAGLGLLGVQSQLRSMRH